MADKLTAAEHFAKAEELLADMESYRNRTESVASDSARAQAHIAAARFLLDLHIARNTTAGNTGVSAAGLNGLAHEKRGV
ncbi:hypothetical protein ACWGCW_00810 [Streptomyces sp. NPDC054933]